MKIRIDPRILEKFPGLILGVIYADNADNNGEPPAVLREKTVGEIERIRSSFAADTLSRDPRIDVWRKAYSAFGGKPKENRSSVESLYRLVLSGKDLRSINKIVDCYNLISLARMLPLGGEDLDHVQGDIILTFASDSEAPVLLLGDKEERAPHSGEVIYRDAHSAICRRWNWREADRTKLTEATKRCVLVIEGLPPVTGNEVDEALSDLEQLMRNICGAETRKEILEEGRLEMELR